MANPRTDTILENSRKKDAVRWWKFNIFSNKDESESSEISVFGSQLYLLLFYAIFEDLCNIWYQFIIICWTFINFLNSIIFDLLSRLSKYVIFVIVLFILVFIAYILLIQSSKLKYKRNNKADKTEVDVNRKHVKNNSSCDSDLDSSVHYHYFNRKYLKLMIKVVFLGALLTLPWEFIRLYQSAVAEKMSLMIAGTPAECIPHKMTYLQSLMSSWRSYFSWSTSDPCYEYQKALLVDPLWQVTPLKVISSAFSHCIVFPFEVILGGIGRGLRQFFAEIPAFWQPFMFIVLTIIIVLLLVMACGYRIHIPLLFRFEPKTPVYVQKGKSSKLRKEKKNSKPSELNHQDSKMLIFRKTPSTPTTSQRNYMTK